MRNLVVCSDGTWNTPDQEADGVPVPTNVVRLHNALAKIDGQRRNQLKYYHPGVGTEGGALKKLLGGGAGAGLSKNVMSGYKWLGANYRSGDRIFLFGFSRGAYTVRSLAGMIGACGLLDLKSRNNKEIWKRVETAYAEGYRTPKEKRTDWWERDWGFHHDAEDDPEISVFFLGVWDTVGALGIPDELALLNILDPEEDYAFHDTALSDKIEHARHAVSIDEMRSSFTPTLWTNVAKAKDAVQIWFPGVHSDVGGGYPEHGLSDGALEWMIDEAEALGLAFDPKMKSQIKPNHRDVVHNSRTGVFELLRIEPRPYPQIDGRGAASNFHSSARKRHSDPPIEQTPFHPTTNLKPNESTKVTIYAKEPWNSTGVYLIGGVTYKFTARGQWVDRTITCGPGGTRDGKFQLGELVHSALSLWGKFEKVFQKVTGNEAADFRGTKREEDMDWFSLVGVVANRDEAQAPAGGIARHESFCIGSAREFRPTRSGYLYCFANDAWHFYDNNHGSVDLTIRRL